MVAIVSSSNGGSPGWTFVVAGALTCDRLISLIRSSGDLPGAPAGPPSAAPVAPLSRRRMPPPRVARLFLHRVDPGRAGQGVAHEIHLEAGQVRRRPPLRRGPFHRRGGRARVG